MTKIDPSAASASAVVEAVVGQLPAAFARLRPFPMRDALLLFDRDTGQNVLCDGPETLGLRAVAPRVVQFGITNRRNLACRFCSRDLDAASGAPSPRPAS